MEEDIIQKIKSGELEEAREAISKIEEEMRLEASVYNRIVLCEKIKRLKEVYKSCLVTNVGTIPFKQPVSFSERVHNTGDLRNKTNIKDLDGDMVKPNDCAEMLIEKCYNTVFEYFFCEGSVFLRGCKDCLISCHGKQIRVCGCSNIELTICTPTGVFLQNSSGVIIKKFEECENNNFSNVRDFSSPFSSCNYKILQ